MKIWEKNRACVCILDYFFRTKSFERREIPRAGRKKTDSVVCKNTATIAVYASGPFAKK